MTQRARKEGGVSGEYPIPVEDFKGDQSLTIVCESCHAERVISPDELTNEDIYDCPVTCGGTACHKYALADRCPGCGTLGWWETPYSTGACSRACHLQAEYAQELTAKKSDPAPAGREENP